MSYTRVASLRTAELLRTHLAQLGVSLPLDEVVQHGDAAPLAQPLHTPCKTVGNRFAVLPMEGWDGTPDGLPSDLTVRRWQRFGTSGAKLIWGGEAVAVRHDGRANPNQLVANEHTAKGLAKLRDVLLAEHESRFGKTDDVLIGLQLTHSGRFARPNSKSLETAHRVSTSMARQKISRCAGSRFERRRHRRDHRSVWAGSKNCATGRL